AAAELERAHSAWPREVNTNYELGNAHVRTGDYPAAILAYGEALKSNPGYDEIFFNLAVIQKKTGAFADAARNLRLSALINPLNTQTYHAAAEVYASSPSVHAAEAVRLLSGAARIFPADPSFRNLLGYFHSVLGDHRAAADAYGRAVRLDPYNKTSESNLRGTAAAAGQARNGHLRWLGFYREAERLLQTGNPKDALAYADRLLDGEGGEARARYLISKARFASGDLRGAREELTLTLAADPDHNEARYGLAALLERSGETEAAARQWELLLQREPGNAKAAERLAALRREGQ
ncbi:MAG TPA: tetratricopeptide repeat protein, partial [Elusimicrobiales bacterium]|nr:tetratricopeptide repeat protein [Elusimicrobiales bacterium]